MERYEVTINGLSPLLMHADNYGYAEQMAKWRKDPANSVASAAGDDRVPAWSWLGYVYHDRRVLGIPSDNLMTMLREGGAKVKTPGTGKTTFKKATQSGILVDEQQFTLYVGGKPVPIGPFDDLIGNLDFNEHMDTAKKYGFELLVKRAKIGRAKHIRVRPLFRDWTAVGTLTVMDSEQSGLTQEVLETILAQAGSLCGLGDWRPSSATSPGTFGRFSASVRLLLRSESVREDDAAEVVAANDF